MSPLTRPHPIFAAGCVRKAAVAVPLALVCATASTARAAPRAGDDREPVVIERGGKTIVVDPEDTPVVVDRNGERTVGDVDRRVDERVIVVVEDDDDDDDDARVQGARDARLRMHFDTHVVGGSWFDPDGDADSTVSLGAGFPRGASIEDAGGITRPLIGFGLGYIFDERAILGAKMAFTVDAFAIENDDPTVLLGGRFVPYFHWMFRPRTAIRPYMEVRGGIGGSSALVDTATGGQIRTSVIYPVVGGGIGLHMFPHDRFSIDLGLDADYVAPFVMTSFSDDRPDTDWDQRGDMVAFGLLLGFSAWF